MKLFLTHFVITMFSRYFKIMFICEDYGDKENADLGERFGIKSDDYPEYRLFIQGKSEPIKYTGDEGKSDKIKQFVAKETGKFYILTIMPFYCLFFAW